MVSSSQGEAKVKSKLKELVAKREMETGQRIRQADIAKATGLNPNTISRWMSPVPFDRFESKALASLCEWLGVEPGDLLYIDRSN
jgi:DNA-binding Xre family transcriptional regulator